MNKIIKKSILKITAFLIIVGLNWAGISAVGRTLAYHFDNEDSIGNFFKATLLDFSITNRHQEGFIGMEALSEIKFASVVTKKTGSLNTQYEVRAEMLDGSNEDFCNALIMEAEHNGVEKHDGPLLSLSAATTTELGTWEFEIDLPVSATNVPHGAECNVDLVFKGWRTDVLTFEESGFTDEERIELRLTSRMIVLNEFLPNPNGLVPDYGFDFGSDTSNMPQGEWVELYNNSDFAFDLSGWYIKDNLESDTNKIMISASNTIPAGTVIGAKSWLVVYMNKAVFNNDGDTVKLFNPNNELVDSHAYTGNDYCEMEPTPGEENTTDTDGSCAGVPPNKSYARIPDGIGDWVDPIPTPGSMNKLEEEIEDIEEVIPEEVVEENSDEEVVESEEITEEPATTTEEITEETTEETNNPVENEPEQGIVEQINEAVDGMIEGIVDEIMPDQSEDESGEASDDTVVDDAVIESESSEETPIIQQAPATEEQAVVAPAGDSGGESGGDSGDSGGSADGGGEGASTE